MNSKPPPILPTEPFKLGPVRIELQNRLNKFNDSIKSKNPKTQEQMLLLQIKKIEQLLIFLANSIDGTKAPTI